MDYTDYEKEKTIKYFIQTSIIVLAMCALEIIIIAFGWEQKYSILGDWKVLRPIILFCIVFTAFINANRMKIGMTKFKKIRKRMIIMLAIPVGAVFVFINIIVLTFVFLMISARVEQNTDISKYNQYIGVNAEEKYKSKWDMDETIFPEQIEESMKVQDYKMVYYDPFDAQYLSYLVVDYENADYKQEMERLSKCGISTYQGYYGATGFDEKYKLVAMNADSYQGFVYALTDGKGEIIYVEIIFCNFFMDLNYKKYIPEEYLPVGFNAKPENPYGRKMLKTLQ